MTREEIDAYDFIVENGIATSEELNLARNLLDGSWLDILNSVLYVRAGYRTIEQMIESENDDEI
jgi:hypothetical protein